MKIGIVFLTHTDGPVYRQNVASFRQWNPDCEIIQIGLERAGLPEGPNTYVAEHIHNISFGDMIGSENADLPLYCWYGRKREHADKWLICEWDTFCTGSIRQFFEPVEFEDVACSEVVYPGKRYWPWFEQIARMPVRLREFACGLVPFSGVMVTNRALAAMVKTFETHPFSAQNELRFGTLANFCGFTPVENPQSRQQVQWILIRVGTEFGGRVQSGIWHSVKYIVPSYDVEHGADVVPPQVRRQRLGTCEVCENPVAPFDSGHCAGKALELIQSGYAEVCPLGKFGPGSYGV